MKRLLLGVDGGRTKTVALVAEPGGAIVGAGRAGCADIHADRSAEPAIAEIVRAVEAALAVAGAEAASLSHAVFSLAGADWPEDFELLRSELGHRLAIDSPTVVNDSIGAIRTAPTRGVGVGVVVGTGGAIGARNGDALFHLGFWPERMGGSAMGQGALQAIQRSALGLEAPTALCAPVLAAYGAMSAMDLLHRLTARATPPQNETQLARLAPIVLDAARAGDAAASAIVDEQGRRLGEAAGVSARRVGLDDEYPMLLAGGVLRHPHAEALEREILRHARGAELVRARVEPAVGALLLAFDAAGIEPDPAQLAATTPPATLFAST